MPAADNRPFAIQLEVEFLDRLNEPVRDGKAKSVSEIIRAALERFDLSKVVVVRPPQLLISVRLPGAVRSELKKAARAKHTSVGQLVRAAVEAYLPQLEAANSGQLEMPIPPVELPDATPPAAAAPSTAPARPKPSNRKRRAAAKPRPPARAPARKQSAPKPKRTRRAKR
jgi:predicted DNA-binding protein